MLVTGLTTRAQKRGAGGEGDRRKDEYEDREKRHRLVQLSMSALQYNQMITIDTVIVWKIDARTK